MSCVHTLWLFMWYEPIKHIVKFEIEFGCWNRHQEEEYHDAYPWSTAHLQIPYIIWYKQRYQIPKLISEVWWYFVNRLNCVLVIGPYIYIYNISVNNDHSPHEWKQNCLFGIFTIEEHKTEDRQSNPFLPHSRCLERKHVSTRYIIVII